MAASSRRKGVTGEAEVRRILEGAGYDVRGLEGRGDWLCLTGAEVSMHIEVKRAERLKLPEWLRQAQDDAADGAVPVVVHRQNRGEWYGSLPLMGLLRVAGRWTP